MGALATFERTMDRWTGGWVNHEPTRSTGAVDRNKLVNLREVQTYWEGRQNGTPFGRDEENNLAELGRHQTMAALNHAIDNGRVGVYFSTGLPNQTYNARMLKFAYVQAGDVIDAADAAEGGTYITVAKCCKLHLM